MFPASPPSPNQQPTNYQNSYPSYYSGFNSTPSASYNKGFQRINGLEVVVITIIIITLLSVFLWGLFNANTANRDSQRVVHIQSVILALGEFYKNSSLDTAKRAYPISQCSTSLNEVDYELIVRKTLTGQNPSLDPHAYISPDNFPRDPWGQYDSDFTKRAVPFRCLRLLPKGSESTSYDDNYPSCNFSSTKSLNKCYLYTSSNNGDYYQIGYWSEVSNRFVVYSKFRDDNLKKES